jgi:catechol 2,3-dioxygenase
MPLPPETRIGRVRLRVADLDRAQDFYSRALGLHLLGRENGLATMSPDGETPLVELDTSESAGGPPAPRRSTGLFHVAYLFPSRETLGRAVQRVLDAGVPLTGASDHLVSEAIYLNDPDGNGIEIYRDRPHEQWPEPPPGQNVAIDTLPLDLGDVLAQAGPDEGGADPATTVGHVHLKVSDLERSVGFYRDSLGLGVKAALGDQAAFLAAGDYHHHLGLNVWQSRGAPPPPPGSAGLDHFTVVVPGLETDDRELSDPDGIRIVLEPA